jgi:GH24 family phage-related lysozyme (muramidase)
MTGSSGARACRTRARRVSVGAVWLALLISGVTGAAGNASPGASNGRAASATPGPSLTQYTVTLTLTGTATQHGDNHCADYPSCVGDLWGMSYSSQFKVNEAWTHVLLPTGSGAPALPQTGGVPTQHTVTGTYSESGSYDPDGTGNLVPYSCSGPVADNAGQGSAYDLTGQPVGSAWSFTAQILHYGLTATTSGGPAGSPCDDAQSFVDGPTSAFGDPEWTAAFTIPPSQLGNDTITETVTGPPADATPPANDCGDQCTFAMSWTAKVTFTRDCQRAKKMSDRGKKQLKKEEGGLVRKPYNDQQHYCTVGIGHLLHYSPCTAQDNKDWNPKTDEAKLDQLFDQDLAKFQDALNKVQSHLKLNLTQCQYDALVDLMFNAGNGAVTSKNNSGIYQDLAAGDLGGVAGAITTEDYGTAKQRAKRQNRTAKTKHDLAKRRGAEAKEFTTPNCPC